MGARPPWKPSSAPHRVLDGGTRRSSKIWMPYSTGGSVGSARNIPSTTTALIDQDTLQCPQNARETETYNISVGDHIGAGYILYDWINIDSRRSPASSESPQLLPSCFTPVIDIIYLRA